MEIDPHRELQELGDSAYRAALSVGVTIASALRLAVAVVQLFLTIWITIFKTTRGWTEGATEKVTRGPELKLLNGARASRAKVEA